MSKSKNKNRKKTNNKKVTSNKQVINNIPDNQNTKNIVKTAIIVLVVFGLIYLLTVYITSNSTDSVVKKKIENTTIQNDEILAGTSFNQKDDEYMVIFYNQKEDEDSTYYTLKADYEAKEKSLPIYYVDLSSPLNKTCVSNTDNSEATNAEELQISQPTLIKIKNGEIEDYLIGESEIKNYLS